jgi:hypothetical protein
MAALFCAEQRDDSRRVLNTLPDILRHLLSITHADQSCQPMMHCLTADIGTLTQLFNERAIIGASAVASDLQNGHCRGII